MAIQTEGTGDREAATACLVAVVDDDESVRDAIPALLRELGFEARAFRSGVEFLASGYSNQVDCLMLDVYLADMSGPELQQELVSRGINVPIIFITARVDDSVREKLLKSGAVGCLYKPFGERQLKSALDAALQNSRKPD